jgi:hypothetical protein
MKFNPELNTKVEKNSPRFSTIIYMPSNGRRFMRNNFWAMTGFAGNWNSGQIAGPTENKILGLFAWDFSPENTKKLENSSSFSLVTYTAWSKQRFRSYGILCINKTVETIWDRTAVGRYKIPETKLIRNSRSPEYYFGRQLSQLYDCPINNSKDLSRQSETRPVAESAFLGRLYLPV